LPGVRWLWDEDETGHLRYADRKDIAGCRRQMQCAGWCYRTRMGGNLAKEAVVMNAGRRGRRRRRAGFHLRNGHRVPVGLRDQLLRICSGQRQQQQCCLPRAEATDPALLCADAHRSNISETQRAFTLASA
jgi:hypothetical protein